MKVFKGIPASNGIALAPAFVYNPKPIEITSHCIDDAQAEWQRLTSAVDQAVKQLDASYERALQQANEDTAAIFTAQAEMLGDPELMDGAKNIIFEEHINAEYALHQMAETFARMLEELEDELLRARAADVRDVALRVIRIMMGVDYNQLFEALKLPSIILASDLTPSDTINMDKALVRGFCTASGGSTSHTAILARTLGLPAIVGAGTEMLSVASGVQIALDGGSGEIIADPDQETTKRFIDLRDKANTLRQEMLKKAKDPAVTLDGIRIEVVSNVGSVEESRSAVEQGAEGVGLLRTEFVYLGKDHLPGEEEQYQAYKSILAVFGQLPVVLRTLDSGGDKELPYLKFDPEMNPFLGVRAIRLCLQRPDLFKAQLRAVLRAGVGYNLKIMFPMIATVAELRAARKILDECKAELQAENQPLPEKLEIGIMVEIPSAVMLADHLAKEVDFFSIGTNDLTQYTCAADRTNPGVGYLSDALSPAVLRMVQRSIDEAHKAGIWIGMCGELAGEPLAIPILLGLGLDEFSMNAPSIPLAKHIIRSLSRKDCQEIARKALEMSSADEVKSYVQREVPVVSRS
ncbi:MAG TPA: phosphoenolpyruvate--protein phosphotransferase [Anaerolineaceae bacterium]